MNIYSCLLALLLACNVTAEIIHQPDMEGDWTILPCPHSVEGKVTWSREINGRKVDILETDGDKDQRFNDPQKRYSSLLDKSLAITRLSVSDSGTYYCNNEPAAEVTVIPSGTEIVGATERSNITLTCPHDDGGSHVPTWSREIGGKQKPIRLHVSTGTKTLMFPNLQPADSGLYLCDGKPAVYLHVIKEEKRTPTTTTTPTSTMITATVRTPTRRQTAAVTTSTTTKKQNGKTSWSTTTSTASAPSVDNTLHLVVRIAFTSVFIITISIIAYCTWRRFKRREEEYSFRMEDFNLKSVWKVLADLPLHTAWWIPQVWKVLADLPLHTAWWIPQVNQTKMMPHVTPSLIFQQWATELIHL